MLPCTGIVSQVVVQLLQPPLFELVVEHLNVSSWRMSHVRSVNMSHSRQNCHKKQKKYELLQCTSAGSCIAAFTQLSNVQGWQFDDLTPNMLSPLIMSMLPGELAEFVEGELNVRSLTGCADQQAYATLRAEPEFQILGKRLGKGMGAVAAAVRALGNEDILRYEAQGQLEVAGELLGPGDMKVGGVCITVFMCQARGGSIWEQRQWGQQAICINT